MPGFQWGRVLTAGFVSCCEMFLCPEDSPGERNQQLGGYFCIFCVPKEGEFEALSSHPHPWSGACALLPSLTRNGSIFIDPYLTLAGSILPSVLLLSSLALSLQVWFYIPSPHDNHLASKFPVFRSSFFINIWSVWFLLVISNILGDSKKDCVGGCF